MTTQIIVVEDKADWKFTDMDCPVVYVDDYLTRKEYFNLKNVQVINLCRSYKYLSVAYYCSLLAEARNHKVIPSVKVMMDLSSKAMYSLNAVSLDEEVARSFRKYHKDSHERVFEMDVFFGKCRFEAMADLARQIFEVFPCPLLRIGFRRAESGWHIESIKTLSLHRLDRENLDFLPSSYAIIWSDVGDRPGCARRLAMTLLFCTMKTILCHHRIKRPCSVLSRQDVR